MHYLNKKVATFALIVDLNNNYVFFLFTFNWTVTDAYCPKIFNLDNLVCLIFFFFKQWDVYRYWLFSLWLHRYQLKRQQNVVFISCIISLSDVNFTMPISGDIQKELTCWKNICQNVFQKFWPHVLISNIAFLLYKFLLQYLYIV